jgi:hypothetical protein
MLEDERMPERIPVGAVRLRFLRQPFVRNDGGIHPPAAVQSLLQAMGVGQDAESERPSPVPGVFVISRSSQSTISECAADLAR